MLKSLYNISLGKGLVYFRYCMKNFYFDLFFFQTAKSQSEGLLNKKMHLFYSIIFFYLLFVFLFNAKRNNFHRKLQIKLYLSRFVVLNFLEHLNFD